MYMYVDIIIVFPAVTVLVIIVSRIKFHKQNLGMFSCMEQSWLTATCSSKYKWCGQLFWISCNIAESVFFGDQILFC